MTCRLLASTANKLLRFCELARSHGCGDRVPFSNCLFVALRSREVCPHMGKHIILRNTFPAEVHSGKIDLSLREASLCSFCKPVGCLLVVLRHTSSLQVQKSEIDLRESKACLRSFGKPPHSLLVILYDTFAFLVHRAKKELG